MQDRGAQVEADLLGQMQNLAVPLGRFYYLGQEFLRVWVRDLEVVAVHGGSLLLMDSEACREALNRKCEALEPPRRALGLGAKPRTDLNLSLL